MIHRKLEFTMPAPAAVVFDAFHYHQWRHHWDSLVSGTEVVGGAPCPYVGAITQNAGGGWLRGLSMQTRFVSFDRPRLAAATMVGTSFPFSRWAASMRHREVGPKDSLLIYTYTLDVTPRGLAWLLRPAVHLVFAHQTRKRFRRLQNFLAGHAHEVLAWQQLQEPHGIR
ncbi:SRPBCC family protein [Rhodoferax saidenbachensis]|uniref:Polyketide cyclase n=1 Tax=Rhodoferax saidenbachensis TaxID=1484693 RepID=A0ABU1ZQF5_9BURK|nr:SRPBCC family protein [Rhodoferax saidenbachensis]MDR7307770.1 hypothetical protein [Rhodoferax saidenbachensis]